MGLRALDAYRVFARRFRVFPDSAILATLGCLGFRQELQT